MGMILYHKYVRSLLIVGKGKLCTGDIPDLEGVVSCDRDAVVRWAFDLLGLLFSR